MPRNLGTHGDEFSLSGFPPELDLQLRGVGDAKLQVSLSDLNLSLHFGFLIRILVYYSTLPLGFPARSSEESRDLDREARQEQTI